jgi:hypothetical protein
VLFTLGAVAFETREIHWTGELIFAMVWLRAGRVDRSRCIDVLAYPPVRSGRVCKSVLSGAGRDRLFRFYPFRRRLDAISILGMVICAGGVALSIAGLQNLSIFDVN